MAAPFFDFSDAAPRAQTDGVYSRFGKRAFDLLILVLMLPVALPLMAMILLVTLVTSGRPLYSQLRVGRNGQLFRCWKVRTMVRDAEAVLERILRDDPALANEWQQRQKLSRDPRVTAIGRILRRTSLDELPQLWNVLTGSMSLVGPRPFTPDQKVLYGNGCADADYYKMRPGITGQWQVCCRNRGSFGERVVHDGVYWENLSLLRDLQILFRTTIVVFAATGV